MSLRDLIVSIDFDDVDIKKLLQVDTAMDEIEDSLGSMGREMKDVASDFVGAGKVAGGALDEIRDEARDATRAIDKLGDTDATPDGIGLAAAELLFLKGALDGATGSSARLGFSMGALGVSFKLAGGGAALLGVAIVSVMALIVAAAAPLLVLIGGLGASLIAAGGAAAGFGAVAIPAIVGVFEATDELAKAEEKLAKADTWKEKVAAQKELNEILDGMSEAQIGAVKELNKFKKFWGEFSAQFEDPIFDIFAVGLEATTKLFTRLEPTIHAVTGVVGDLMDEFNRSLGSSGATQFFGWLESNGAEAIRNFATIGGNLISGVWEMFGAFSPIGASIEEGLVNLTSKFKEWADGLSASEGFQSFIDYALETGPVLMDVLGNVWDIFVELSKTLAPFGSDLLSGLQSFTDYLLENWPAISDGFSTIVDGAKDFAGEIRDNWPTIENTIVGVVTAVGAFALIMGGLSIINTVTAATALWAAGNRIAALSMLGLNGAMLTSPLTWIVVAIAAVIAIGVLLWKNWDTVKIKAGELWDKTKEVFGGIYDWGASKIQPVANFFSNLGKKFGEFKDKITNFKLPDWVNTIGSKIGSATSKIGNFINGSHANGLERVPFDGYTAELHKDEAVLTATQANALRMAGILSGNGSRPSVEVGSENISSGTGRVAGGGGTFAPQVNIQIDGSGLNEEQVGQKVKVAVDEALEEFFRKMNLKQA